MMLLTSWDKKVQGSTTHSLSEAYGSFILRENESEFFKLIFVAAQCEHYTGFSMNPSGTDIVFAPIKRSLRVLLH